MIGLLAAVVILLLTFGSVVAMGLPLLTALFALGVGISLVTLGTHVFDTANFAPQLAAMIGLGVGIDYALFILTRFRNGLDEGLEPRPAAIAAVDTAGRAVLFAGITVIISLMGMLLLGISFLYGVAMAAALAVLFTMIAALTLLPALLTIAGRRVDRLRIPGLGKREPSTAEDTRWFRWSHEIQRRPVLSAVLSGGLLLLLCVPTLSLRLGSNDAGTDPAGSSTREAYDLLAEGFGPGFNGPFAMVAALPGKGDDEALVTLRNTLKNEEGVAKVTSITLNPAKDTGVFQLYPTTSPQSADTTKLLDHIRDDVLPPIEQQTGARLHVGGITAIFEDFGDAIAEKLPLFIGVVVLLSALLLMAVFRSVLVPLKAMVMNLLSIGAAFGLIVAVFQWGWGASLIGVDGTGPIISFFPVFLFAIIFGLSMDYEVFLMSRIHEEWERQARRDPRGHPRPGADRPRDHRRRGDHGHRLRLLHDRRRPHHQTLRPRPRLGRLHRRRDHPLGPRPGDHAALRQERLVAAGLARPAPAPPTRRARRGRSGTDRRAPGCRERLIRPEAVGPSEGVPAAKRQCSSTTRSRRCGLAQRPTASGGLGDLVGLEAARADVSAQLAAVLFDPHLLQVRVEAPLGGDHRVAAGLAERRSLAAAVANLGHRVEDGTGRR